MEQCWCNSDGGIMLRIRRTVLVEQCCGTVLVVQRNSGRLIVEQCGGRVE